jgi:alkaline phosphatase
MKYQRKVALFIIVLLSPYVVVARRGHAEVSQTVEASPPPRVILLIGDGMGPQHVGFLSLYRKTQGKKSALDALLSESTLSLTLSTPYPDGLINDSACAATQISTGKACKPEAINVDEGGNKVAPFVVLARERKVRTGLISDTRITHATPAAFFGRGSHRSDESTLAEDAVTQGADLMLSGGKEFFLPQGVAHSKRKDKKNLLERIRKEKGCSLLLEKKELFSSFSPTCVFGLFAYSGLQNGLDERFNVRNEPTLKEMALVALDYLSKDPHGFFLMIEGGQIDWASHANDAGWLLAEMLRFDATVAAVHEWAKSHPSTKIIVTADHETGGFGLSYRSGQKHEKEGIDYLSNRLFTLLDAQKKTVEQAAHEGKPEKILSRLFPLSLLQAIKELPIRSSKDSRLFPPSELYDPKVLESAQLAHQFGIPLGITWSTGGHTHTPVITSVWPREGEPPLSGIHSHRETHKYLLSLF